MAFMVLSFGVAIVVAKTKVMKFLEVLQSHVSTPCFESIPKLSFIKEYIIRQDSSAFEGNTNTGAEGAVKEGIELFAVVKLLFVPLKFIKEKKFNLKFYYLL
jgi:hypothetical protein